MFLLYFAAILLAVFLGLRSLHTLVALRKEKREVRDFFDSELVGEIKKAIVDEISKSKRPPVGRVKEERPSPKDPLAGLLMEIYDDLYTRVAEEEAARKKSLDELRSELEKLRNELKSRK